MLTDFIGERKQLMKLTLEAACLSNRGKIRGSNEDNFYFDGRCMPQDNNGLRNPAYLRQEVSSGIWLAVFDGMGGENFGETAAFAAAQEMQRQCSAVPRFLTPEKDYLTSVCMALNNAVVEAARQQATTHMGTTLAALYVTHRSVYACNVGDSRAYRLRNGEFLQLSQDHVDSRPLREGRKPALTQHLGIDPEELLIEPHIAKGQLLAGDRYLLCSDGLVDMLTNFEITDIMLRNPDVEPCAEALVQAALDKGGRDNVTVIVCGVE